MDSAAVANPSAVGANTGDEKSDVLQFLLGVAPLQQKHKGFKGGSKKPNACDAISDSTSPSSLLHVNNDSERVCADGPEEAIPVLEYTPECESDDDYIELEESIVQVQNSETDVNAVDSNIATAENAHDDEEKEDHQMLDSNEDGGSAHPTILDLPTLVDASELDHDVEEDAVDGDFKHNPITNNKDALFDIGSNCMDDDRGLSGGEESRGGGAVEIEEEPSEQPELPDFIHKLGDDLANTVKESSYHKPSSLLGDGSATNSFGCTASDCVDMCSLKTVQTSSDLDELRSVTSNTSATDESHHEEEEDQDESYDAPVCCSQSPPHRAKQTHGQNAYEPSMPSRSELLFVTCVAVALVLYVAASIYAFFHPIFVPLPLLNTLQTPFDMSNVTVAITSPQNDSILQQSAPTIIEWTLVDYPMQVIEVHGPEVFHYRVFVNDVQILYEIGLLSHSAPPGGLEDHTTAHSMTPGIQDAVPVPQRATFNTTVRHRIAAAHLSSFGTYNIRVEVQFLIPGSEDGMQTLTQSVTVTKALEVYRTLELLSPSNGSTFAQGKSVLLEYKATHVNELEIVIDGSLSALVRNIDDGKFLLRGLGTGTHTIQLRGYDVHDNTVPSSKDVHVMHVQ